MGNTGLLRREAEMTLLQPQLGETRHQELRNSPFWHSSLFKSQLVKEGEDFLLKKGTSKESQGFGPYQNKPFCGLHNKKRGSLMFIDFEKAFDSVSWKSMYKVLRYYNFSEEFVKWITLFNNKITASILQVGVFPVVCPGAV